MITFKSFLSEASLAPTKVSHEAFIEWCEKNAPNYLRRVGTVPIYRGMPQQCTTGIVDTSTFDRKSANTKNYYTVWMDNDPLWAEYPKRSKSYIASNKHRTSRGFGPLHLLIPKDNVHVGICSEDDLWISFQMLGKIMHTQGYGYSMGDFANELHKIFTLVDSDTEDDAIEYAESDYPSLIRALKMINADVLREWGENAIRKIAAKRWLTAFGEHNFNTAYDMMKAIMDPGSNNFQHYRAGEMKPTILDSEYWLQGEIGVIAVSELEKASDYNTHPLHKFAYKYLNDVDVPFTRRIQGPGLDAG
jgi:hypothetical protein